MFRNKKTKRNLVVVLMVSIGFAGLLGEPGLAAADTIESVEVRITASDDYFETSPTLGSDDVSDMVVYTSCHLLPDGSIGLGEIMCQRLDADGLPDGPVIQVSDGTTDDRLNDVSGPLIVYSAFLTMGSQVGQVKVFDLNSGQTETITEDAAAIFEARICGTAVVWTQCDPDGFKVMYYDLAWGTSLPVKVGGPSPPARNVDIGERFIVWEEGPTYQNDIKAYDHILGTTTTVSNDPDSDEGQPATSGNWVVWEATAADGTMTIELADLSQFPCAPDCSAARYTAVANHANTFRPSIIGSPDADLVAYESDLYGNYDIFLYRISDGAGFQVTTQEDNQWLNNLFGNKVAYADERNASRDIYVSTFEFVPVGPCVEPPSGLVGWWPGDGDADDIWGENHGTLVNGATFVSGKVEQAFSFDGVDDYVEVPDDASLKPGTSCFTVDFWVRTSNVEFQLLLLKGGSEAGSGGLIEFATGFVDAGDKITYVLGDGDGHNIRTDGITSPDVIDGEWHHIALTVDGPNQHATLYVDGVKDFTRSITGLNSIDPDGPLLFGGGVGVGDMKGELDEIEFFDRELSEPEIEAIYNAGSAGKCKQADIDVSPAEYDFGEVELGTSSTVILTIYNAGCGDLTVDSIEFAAGSSADFTITTIPSLPAVVAPGGTLGDVEITYTASAEGLAAAGLEIGSDDPDEPLVAVSLSGTGVEVELPPSEQIQATLDFFDASVDDGTLVGDGPGNSAENRLNALRNMIETAGDLIEDGLLDDACQQLQDAYKKTDGEPRPPDFVTGEATSVLAILIQDLMTSIGCG